MSERARHRPLRRCNDPSNGWPLDKQNLLDPEIAAIPAALPVDIGKLLGSLSDATLQSVRELMGKRPSPELSDDVRRTDYAIDGADGVVVRVHPTRHRA